MRNQLVCAVTGAWLLLAGCMDDYPPVLVTTVGDASVAAPFVTQSRARIGLAGQMERNGFPVVYGINSLLQIAPDAAALLAMRTVYSSGGTIDLEDGVDGFVVRSLDDVRSACPIACTRSGIVKDPDFGGKDRFHVNYGMLGGFVPYGAKVGGKPHPHAGTGFGISLSSSHSVASDGTFDWKSWQTKGQVALCLKIFELSYDGKSFKAKLINTFGGGTPLHIGETGWMYTMSGLGNAIPDGMDLLMPSMATKVGVDGPMCGLSRWQRSNGMWRPVDFQPLGETGERWGEPSVVRLSTGALLFCVRDDHKKQPGHPGWIHGNQQDFHVWLSKDNGRSWIRRVEVADVRMGAPVALGRANDGTAYLVANPGYPEPVLDKRRNVLNLWPLSKKLDALGKPQTIRNAKDFTSGYGSWNIDHPIYSVVRLADGKVHGFLSYRVRDNWRDPKTGKPIETPSADAGAYIEEVIGAGKGLPVWEF